MVDEKKITEAQIELSKLSEEYNNNAEYLYLRGKISYLKKLYYPAIDALLIALEFEKNEKIYKLLSEIYGVLGNNELNKKIQNPDLRLDAINELKGQLTGIYRI